MNLDFLLNEARQRTGLNDFGDDSFLEPMRQMLRSIEQDSHLSAIGTAAVPEMMIGRLVNRLQIEDWYHRHPEIDTEKIIQPVFITGLPRTGSTALGHMLALDPATRSLRTWEAEQPCPPPEKATEHTDPRIAASRERAAMFDQMVPALRQALPRSIIAPEECFYLLDLSFTSFGTDGFLHVPSYIAWLMEHPETYEPAYRYHQRVLKLLQWRCPPHRWQLRTPVHAYAMDALLKVYPDARFVMTHRDPVRVMASIASLMNMVRTPMLANPQHAALGHDLLHNWSIGMQRLMAFRDRVGEARFFDMAHRDQVRNPIPGLRALYAWLGWTFDDATAARIEAWRGDNPKGEHRPDASAFGIEAAETARLFEPYIRRFHALF